MKHEGVFRPKASRIHVYTWERQGFSVPMMCQQCKDAPCTTVCMPKAMTRNLANGQIDLDASKCIGCKMCVQACPFGNASWDFLGSEILKCDTCGGDPACARICPTHALEWVEDTIAAQSRKRAFATKLKNAFLGGLSMHGWVGKILRVDLTSGKISTEALEPALARDYIGARGLGTKLMYDEVDPKVDPLSPKNKLMFVSGPMTGTFAPSAGRYNVVTKGPLTDTIAASNSGGNWGPELKFAGYDLLIVEGKAAKPVYLWIQDDTGRDPRRGHLWGKEVPETTELLYAETAEDAKVACIGPAGENLSYIAAIMNDMHRAAGRTGVGAVMGSKNLKAVVVRGTGAVTIADDKALPRRREPHQRDAQGTPVTAPATASVYGTDVLVKSDEFGRRAADRQLPGGVFPDGRQGGRRNAGGHRAAAREGLLLLHHLVRPGDQGHQPEIPGRRRRSGIRNRLGLRSRLQRSMTSMRSPRPTTSATSLGLDTISMGSTVACAMEMFQHGIINLKDTGVSISASATPKRWSRRCA